jgi:hypothetical protein
MSGPEIIAKLEEIEKEQLTPTEFAKKSAQVFNEWAEAYPGELERLAIDHHQWCRVYALRVGKRMKGLDMDIVFGRTTQEEEKP